MYFNKKDKLISFDDVLLIPQYSDILSRSEIDTSVYLTDSFKLDIPILSSPMSTVTEAHMSNAIDREGGLGIIHRYNKIDFQCKLISYVSNDQKKAAAIGASGDYKERAHELHKCGTNIFCIDVAHGHHILVKKAIEHIKTNYENAYLIAGNVSNGKAYRDLTEWGADAIRVSVGSGSICTTRIQTGHGVPTLNAVLECSEEKNKMLSEGIECALIIADGGIKNSGDIVKSIACGADLVMLGSMLSGTKASPGKIMLKDGLKYKAYNGMASKTAQKIWKGSYSSIEGVSTTVKYKGTASKVINEIMSNVRSGMSYSGARSIEEFKEKAIVRLQTPSSNNEGNPHIFNRK